MNQVLKTLIAEEETLNVINILKKVIYIHMICSGYLRVSRFGVLFFWVEDSSLLRKNVRMMMPEAGDDSFVRISGKSKLF